MSYHERNQSDSPAPKKRRVPTAAEWANKPLSAAQKASLAIAGRAAWEIQHQAGLTDADCDAWRHDQVFIACGRAGLREAGQKHFRSISAHFHALCGHEEQAAKIWARTGRVKDSQEIHDTHENREVARAIIRDLAAGSQGAINDAYVAAVCRDKFSGRDLYGLSASESQALVMTLRARLRAKARKAAGFLSEPLPNSG